MTAMNHRVGELGRGHNAEEVGVFSTAFEHHSQCEPHLACDGTTISKCKGTKLMHLLTDPSHDNVESDWGESSAGNCTDTTHTDCKDGARARTPEVEDKLPHTAAA